MNTSTRRLIRTLAILAASVVACSTALADHGHGGGGGGSGARGGGGSVSSGRSGGGSSFSGHGGGNSSFSASRGGGRSYGGNSGGGAHVSSGGGHVYNSAPRGNFSGGSRNFNATAPTARAGYSAGNLPGMRIPGGTRPAERASYNSRPGFTTTRPDFGVRNGSNGSNYGLNSGRSGFNGRRDFNDRPPSARVGAVTRPGYPGYRGNNTSFNRSPGFRGNPGFGRHPHWNGGYWNGSFWPRAYYRSNFVSFWPVLPAAYATYWFSGIPYYYYDDLYYTWSPTRYGYVATDPPPAAESGSVEQDDQGDATPASPDSGSVYVYPRNGQSEEQTATDRFECHQWAASQSGFDPTTADSSSSSSGNAADYRRAMIVCLDGRGYSAN
jgi:hypothetical protein